MNQPEIPVEGASETPEELAAHIDAELGLDTPPAPQPPTEGDSSTPPADDDQDTPDEPVTDEPPVNDDDQDEPEPDDEEDEPTPSEPATPSDEESFIEVQDADGVTHKISKIEDLPEDFSPKNNRQILEIVSSLSKLEAQQEQKAAAAEKAEAEAAEKQAQIETFKAWDSEVESLQKAGRLEKIATSADDPKYNDDPAVKRINDVFGHMNKINEERLKAGNPNLITSFEDALDKFEAQEARDKAAEDEKNQNDLAKKKSGLLGGGSGGARSTGRPYVAGSARSIDDIDVTLD
jgi:hypothetical protein